MKKKVTDEKISTLQTVQCSGRQYTARRAWQFEQSHRVASKVINIADPSKRKNLFHSLVNNSSAQSFPSLRLGKTSRAEILVGIQLDCDWDYLFQLGI